MSISYSTGTQTVERILRIAYGNLSIGTAMTDSLGTSDVRAYIEDGERYINSILEDTISSIPVSPVPNSLKFSSDYMGAYLLYSAVFSANKPGELSDVVKSWKEMVDKTLESFKKGYLAGGIGGSEVSATAGKHSYTPIFDERGVEGISSGLLKDSTDIKTNRYK